MDKKSKNTLIISIIALALVLIGVTYAYFSARITGLESASTITLTAGRMGIVYSEGDEEVTFSNIYPREEAWATKTFTLTGTNTTTLPMNYNLGLNVITNTFTDDYLTYDLRLVSSTNGTPIATRTGTPISGTGKIKLGKGIFTNANGDTHNYELKIYFKDNGLDQNDAQQAVFNAKIYIEEPKDEPDGWSTQSPGTLIAGIRSNYPTLSTMGTIPGVEASASGPVIKTIGVDFCNNPNDCEISYFSSLEDALNYNNPVFAYYSDAYTLIEGKVINDFYVIEATETQMTCHNNNRIFTKESNLLLSAEDDYGTSYYFRGDINNNYVVFANMCWRVVRVVGDGSIKLTLYNYNPTSASNPCSASLDADTMAYARLTANDSGSYYSKYNDSADYNTHIGYMYSNAPSSNDYSTGHANDNDSRILTFLKGWYDRVFTTTDKNKLADVIWCNDKRILAGPSYDPWHTSTALGTGLGMDDTYYQPSQRIYPFDSTRSLISPADAAPSLKCGDSISDNKISKFTASDTYYGNGALNGYKIGMLTSDEVSFAGAVVGLFNQDFYLYKNANDEYDWYWTLSPLAYTGPATNWAVGNGEFWYDGANTDAGAVRPAIALKANTTISGGTGTQANPFIVN